MCCIKKFGQDLLHDDQIGPTIEEASKHAGPYIERQTLLNCTGLLTVRVLLTSEFFFDKGENASQVAEIVNGVYDADTANYVQFRFRRSRLGIFDVKDAPRIGRPVVENVDKITEIIEVDRHVSSPSIPQELKIDHKTVLSHLCKVGFKMSSMFGCHTN
ncbi:histone-lysine N-methyltransferase SETMAR [Trichonephila clavipes]|nr:histone-lysine N-methyltransferase SETMAR [Trichonephila clavipes]